MGFSQLLAVVLGYCVMAGSLFRSVPQIVKVVQHNSTEGLSLMSYLVELCCYSVVIAYNLCQVRSVCTVMSCRLHASSHCQWASVSSSLQGAECL